MLAESRLRMAFLLAAVVSTAAPKLPAAGFSLEAENGTLQGNAYVSTAVPGYSGTGYVTGLQSASDTVNWSFTNQPGVYQMSIRFRSPFGQKGYAGALNGHGFSGTFPVSSVFASVNAGVFKIVAGANTLQIGGGWNWYEIDRVDFTLTNPPPPRPVAATLSDPQASFAARALMACLVGDYARHTWTGQHDASELGVIRTNTGLQPAMVEGDLIDYSPSRVQYQGMPRNYTENYIALDNSGYVLGLCWHWNAPTNLLNTASEPWWSGFYTAATTFDVSAALANTNSNEYALLLRDIDAIAAQLQKLSDKNIPVLWRPLHEAEGGWFWWGAKGPAPFKALWRLLYNRLTVYHGLHNLIWVLAKSGTDPAWYPGNDVVDIVGIDAYPDDMADTLSGTWQALLANYDGVKMLTLAEFGGVPDVETMHQFGVWWSYFSPWSGSYIDAVSPSWASGVYHSAEVVTLDKLNAIPPNIASAARQTNGAFQVSGTGPHGAAFRLLATTNLSLPRANWPVLTNGTLSGGVFTYSDSQATNYPQRFYRIAAP